MSQLRLSVGPAPSGWGTDRLESFYRELAHSPVDSVYLGETACPDRCCFTPAFVGRICDELTQAGKEVYASSPVLVTEDRHYRSFHELARRIEHVEINSPAFLGLGQRYPATGGMFLNVYNATAARILARTGVQRIVLPCELELASVAGIAQESEVSTEVIVHGHIPVAISLTCATARCFGRDESACGEVCRRYPQGMILEAGDRQMFRIEGPQTLSAATYCLVEYVLQLEEAGVETLRILPQWDHTVRIVRVYRDVLDRRNGSRRALEELKALSGTNLCNGWLLGKAGWTYESPK